VYSEAYFWLKSRELVAEELRHSARAHAPMRQAFEEEVRVNCRAARTPPLLASPRLASPRLATVAVGCTQHEWAIGPISAACDKSILLQYTQLRRLLLDVVSRLGAHVQSADGSSAELQWQVHARSPQTRTPSCVLVAEGHWSVCVRACVRYRYCLWVVLCAFWRLELAMSTWLMFRRTRRFGRRSCCNR
jgi:hypothetical protein